MTATAFSSKKRHIPRIDLLHRRREEQAVALRACRRDLAASGIICLLAGSLLVPVTLRALSLQAEIRKTRAAAKTELSGVQAEPTSEGMDARLAQWERFTKSRSQRLVWQGALQSLVASVPPQIALEHILLEGKDGVITVTLSGSSENLSLIKDYVGTLERRAELRQAHLTGSVADLTFGPTAAKFTIVAKAGKAEK